jgi:hypothetical protein
VLVIDSVRKSHIGFETDLELRSGRAAEREYINVLPMSMPASHPDSLPRGPRGEGIARFRCARFLSHGVRPLVEGD